MIPSVRMEGMDHLKRQLAKLDDRTAKKILRRSIRSGARPIRDDARVRAPKRKSYPKRKEGKPLHKTITIRSSKRRRGHREVSVKVITAPHGHLVEYGSEGRVRVGGPKSKRYKGKKFGVMPAQPFMRPAYDGQKRKAIKITGEEIGKGILEALR